MKTREARMTLMTLALALACATGAALAAGGVTLHPVIDPALEKAPPPEHGTVLGPHSIELSWSTYVGDDFAAYRVVYGLTPDLDADAMQAGVVARRGQTSLLVENLNLATAYYFEVYVERAGKGLDDGSGVQVGVTAANPYPWSDDLESGTADWDLINTDWATTTSWSNSPVTSWTDSPDVNYDNQTGRLLQTAVNLMAADKPVLIFQHYHNIQADGDFGYLEISEDSGANWERVLAVTGSSAGWREARVDLTPYRGNVDLYLRWRLVTNTSGVSDGWYVDDVSVAETAYAALTPLVWDDVNDAPTSDATWYAANWLREPGGANPGHHYDDSPLTGVAEYMSTKMTLVNDLDLSGTTAPWLVLHHTLDLDFQNEARVEVSTDGGANWSTLQSWIGPESVPDWTREVIDLSAYAGGDVRLRFHLLNLGVNSGDGWRLDDIQIGDVPATTTLALDANYYADCDISWTEYVGGDFGAYEIYRATASGLLLDGEMIAEITAAGTTTLNDVVDPATVYYYQVFVRADDGRFVSRSDVLERPVYTLPVLAYPFGDDMEGGVESYAATGGWIVTEETAYGGTHSWSDSPGGNYPNNSTAALAFQVDLAGGTAVLPELTFRHTYGFVTNQDWGLVEISTDGGTSWQAVSYYSGESGGWLLGSIDLSPYRNQVLQIRFRVSADGAGQADGWHIDDIALGESDTGALAFPYVDDFNNAAATRADWMAGAFDLTAPGGDGTPYWSNRSTGSLPNFYPGSTLLTLGDGLDLTGATNPKLRFEYRAYDYSYNSTESYVQVSTDESDTWTTLRHLGDTTAWTAVQIDMSGYAGVPDAMFRVRSYDSENSATNPWCDIDNFSLTEAPLDVVLSIADNQPYQNSLSWTQNGEGDFDRYVIKYGTSPDLTIASATLDEITDAGTTTYDHTGLSPYDVYYYKVFVYDDLDVYNDGSNEVVRTAHTPPLLAYPFSDDLEVGDGNFLADLPWALSDEAAHSGSYAWSDSPGAQYGNIASQSVVFSIDLSGGTAVRPELSFWHQYGLQTNYDWGFVDVSIDEGANWSEVYYITGDSGQWRHARVDLTPYRGQVLRLRLRLQTDGSIQGDGWHVDDIAVGETVPPALAYPFTDAFDDSTTTMANWVPGGWGLTEPSGNGSAYISTRPTGGLPDFYPGHTMLSLGAPLDLSGGSAPQLRLTYRGYDSGYNSAETYLQISLDNGETWSTLRQFGNSDDWLTTQIDMSAYATQTEALLRFQAYDGASGSANPYFDLEDFSLSESPADVVLELADNQSYEATVSWTRSAGGFGSYVVKYGTSPDLTIASATLHTSTAVDDTTFAHAGLSPYDVYYYKVFVYDDLGVYSYGSNEVMRASLEAPLLAYPFTDDMESGGDSYLAESPWAVTDETAYSGTHSWSDSPGTQYANNLSTSLVMRIDLPGGGATRPELSFRQLYGFETNADWGTIDLTTDGGATWLPVYYVTGSSGGWLHGRVDLTPYRGSVIGLRFRVWTSGAGQADGWHLDDVSIAENATPPLAYPYSDDFDVEASSRVDWLSGAFGWNSPGDDGTPYASNRSTGNLPDFYPGVTTLALGDAIDLSTAVDPQLRLRYRSYYSSYNQARSYVQISPDGGDTWTTLQTLNAADWATTQLDIAGYAGGPPVLLRVASSDGSNGSTNPWCDVDDFSVSDQPLDVTLAVTEDLDYETTLAWTQTSEGDFARYVLKRSATSPVTLASTTIAEFTAPDDTTYVDSDLDPDQVWYYRVYVYDALDLHSDGSNEVVRADQDPPLLAYPFFDDLEGGGGNFKPELPWALSDEAAYSGNYAWSDSPHGNYDNSVSRELVLEIDLGGGGASRPELSFRHQFGFETNSDWGMIEASTNYGTDWAAVAWYTGTSGGWRLGRVDLTPFRGQVLRLRFRLWTNGSGQADGWHVDDIRVDEVDDAPVGFPFVDTFDIAAETRGSWANGGFQVISPSDDGTAYWSNRSTGSLPDAYPGGTMLSLNGPIDLAGSTHPQVRLRYRAYDSGYNSAETYLQVSQDGGTNWSTVSQFANHADWTSLEADLGAFSAGDPILLRLWSYDGNSGSVNPWCDVEDLSVTEDWQQTAMPDWCVLDQPTSLWLTAGQTSSQIQAKVYEPGVTDAAGQGAGLIAQIGSGPGNTNPTDPAAGWTFAAAAYGGDADGDQNDIYTGSLTGGAVGDYDYCFRFSTDGGNFWIYADSDGNDTGGGGWNHYTKSRAGALVVTVAPELIISETSVEMTLPVGQASSRVLTIGNDGLGPLALAAVEAITPPTAAEVTWLGVAPAEATIPSQEYDNLEISVDASGLVAGQDYGAYVMLYTNDPAYSRLDIPVTVHVVAPSAPHIAGTVLDVDLEAPADGAFVEVYDLLGSLVATTTTGGDGYYIAFGVPEGDYDVRVWAEGYYPITQAATVPSDNADFILHRVPPFVPTNTNVNFYGDASNLDSEPLRQGDVVTVQDAQGVTCGAFTVQVEGRYGFLHAYGDDATTPEVDEGASPGDTLLFRVNGELAVAAGPDTRIWSSDGDVKHVELNATTSLDDAVPLAAGWNLVSFNRQPEVADIATLVAGLTDDGNLELVSSFDMSWGGARTYDPLHPEFSDLAEMDPRHGYWIKVDHADTLVVTGTPFWPDTPLPLEESWNLTSYLPEDSREVERALGSIEGLYALVSGFDGGAQTHVPGDPIHSTLTALANDFGYWVKMDYAAVMSYDYAPGGKSQAPADDPQAVFAYEFTPTPWWDNYYGALTMDTGPIPVGETVYAKDPDGVICGQFTVTHEGHYGFMPVYGDDPATPEDEGATAGDRITFCYAGASLMTAPPSVVWEGGQALKELHLDFATGVDDGGLPTRFALHQPFPNPFNPQTSVKFDLPAAGRVRLAIFDVTGRRVATLVDRRLDPGPHETVWSGCDDTGRRVSSGAYFMRLVAGDKIEQRKVMLVK